MADEETQQRQVKFEEQEPEPVKSPERDPPESSRSTNKDDDEDEGFTDAGNNLSDSQKVSGSSKSLEKDDKSDKIDGLGNDIELVNNARNNESKTDTENPKTDKPIKKESETPSTTANIAKPDESKSKDSESETKEVTKKETSDSDTNKKIIEPAVSIKKEDDTKAKEENKNAEITPSRSSSYHSLGNRGKSNIASEPKDKVSIDEDVETAVNAHYFTDDVKEDSTAKKPQPQQTETKKETKAGPKEDSNEKKENTDDNPKQENNKSEQEKAHLITPYRRPQPEETSAANNKSNDAKTNTKGQNSKANTQQNTTRGYSSQSARYPNRGYQSSRDNRYMSSRATSSRTSRSVPSRPRSTLGFSEKRKEREFFHAELQRLKDSLRKESKKIKKPKVRDHYPDVFTSLEPYYNTYTANYLIKMPDLGYVGDKQETAKPEGAVRVNDVSDSLDADLQYTSRKTAIGLCDPWRSLNMDRQVLPKLETAEIRKKRIDQMHAKENSKPKSAGVNDRNRNTTPREKRPEAKHGSTRLPKFPVILPPNSELATKELVYSDVPMLRHEKLRSFSHFGDARQESDYQRTKQDFYRMELDRIDEYHRDSRPHMRAAYFAYLQNTPGSKKAIYECMKEANDKKKEKEQTPQAVA